MLVDAGLPRPGGAAEVKGTGDYVTESDRKSEAAIVAVLRDETPEIALLAEEAGGSRAGTMWAVDPLDGTTNFMRSFPSVGVSVGLLEAGRPVLGVVIAPYLHLEFAGVVGAGATMNGDPLPWLRSVDPARAVVATGFPFRNKQLLPRYQPVMEKALVRFEDLRRVGAAALDLAWTAAGTFDGFFELGLNTWDVAAGAALVLAVGGRVSDWSGGDTWIQTGNILAGPERVHAALLELAAHAADAL